VKNDKQNPEEALRVDRELVDAGVVAIIGHMTSSMSIVAIPFINKQKVLIDQPHTSTNKLTGIDDYFIRVIPPTNRKRITWRAMHIKSWA